jgi:MoxR-like ATPase
MTIYRAAQAFALASGRDYCIPDDVKYLCSPVFAHRIIIAGEAIEHGMEASKAVLENILNSIEVPV